MIEFRHQRQGKTWIITSPQLPHWRCSAPDQEKALKFCTTSLQCYLRNTKNMDPEIRKEILAMVGSPGRLITF
jgi:hypothetical protein